jgi:HAD superfamily hydrolase (TIGR01484 family)
VTSASPPRVVATDLDGTIVRSDGTISPRTRVALQAAQSAGALVVVVTGRPPRWLGGISAAIGAAGPAICANGALVYDLTTERTVQSYPMPDDVAGRLVASLRAAVPDLYFAVECVDGQFVHEPGYVPRWTPEAGTIVGDVPAAATAAIAKVLARREGVGSDELLGIAREVVGQGLATLTHSSIDGLLEMNACGVTKASTLQRLLTGHGLSASDVVAFGDMPNDLELLTWAGRGVAVANAHPEVLAVVDEVTASNDDDGVALVLERLFEPSVRRTG